MKIYAFADEASPSIDEQIAAMKRNGLNGLEIRGVDGENVSVISLNKAREVRRKLEDAGLSVWSIGSPIGKIDIKNGDFDAHLDQLRHTLDVARELDAKNLRMFSFYIPAGENPAAYRQQVIDQVGRMLCAGEGSGILYCHENEKGIYGDTADRCNELLRIFPAMKGVLPIPRILFNAVRKRGAHGNCSSRTSTTCMSRTLLRTAASCPQAKGWVM